MGSSKPYFPALDAVRAIAILLVFMGHVVTITAYYRPDYPAIELNRLAVHGLVLFFVLSGFLITYLLLQEREERQRIDVPHFYFRRILRIWPLYYLLICIGLFVLPYAGLFGLREADRTIREHLWRMAPWYLLFLPNLSRLGGPVNPYIRHTWSIGTEEQFYLVWPWVIGKGGRWLPYILGWLIGLAFLSAAAFVWVFPLWPEHGGLVYWLRKVNTFFYWSNAGCFSLGGLMAYYRLKRPAIAEILAGKAVQAAALLLSLLLLTQYSHPVMELVLALCFSLLILQATLPGTLLYRLRHPALIHIGKVSYGMYIFHVIIVLAVCKGLLTLGGARVPGGLFVLLALVPGLGLTIGAATLSYRWIESWFLRRKRRRNEIN